MFASLHIYYNFFLTLTKACLFIMIIFNCVFPNYAGYCMIIFFFFQNSLRLSLLMKASSSVWYSNSTVIGVKQEMSLYSRTKKWRGICQYPIL